jgi:hypothetical protein
MSRKYVSLNEDIPVNAKRKRLKKERKIGSRYLLSLRRSKLRLSFKEIDAFCLNFLFTICNGPYSDIRHVCFSNFR